MKGRICHPCAWIRRKDKYGVGSESRRQRNQRLKLYYNITLEDYEKLLKEQAGGCAICGSITELVVDHNHDTGEVRGLLCNPCNFMLGQAKDKPETLRLGASYLERNKG